jgi:hypothetical protein
LGFDTSVESVSPPKTARGVFLKNKSQIRGFTEYNAGMQFGVALPNTASPISPPRREHSAYQQYARRTMGVTRLDFNVCFREFISYGGALPL